jgi:hypothetical protein
MSADATTPKKIEARSADFFGRERVECGGLENRFGPLGPTRVQIPPPPLNQAESRVATPDLALLEILHLNGLKPLENARDWRSLARDWRTPTRSLRHGAVHRDASQKTSS